MDQGMAVDRRRDRRRRGHLVSTNLRGAMRTTTEQETERIARRLAQENGQPALWELFLSAAYEEYFGLPELRKETDE